MLSQAELPQYIYALFQHLPQGQALTLQQRHFICGQWLYVTGMKLAGGDYLIIVTNGNPKESLALYAQRWEIEQFFKAVKKTGFDIEATHLTDIRRIDTLFSLVVITFVWAHRLGEQLHLRVKAIKRKSMATLLNLSSVMALTTCALSSPTFTLNFLSSFVP